MKIIHTVLMALSLLFGSAYASDHEVWVAKNEMGGTILLTALDCPLPDTKGAKAGIIIQGDIKVYGCWFADGNKINAFWLINNQVIQSTYDLRQFAKELII
jgi:hypothetical protein